MILFAMALRPITAVLKAAVPALLITDSDGHLSARVSGPSAAAYLIAFGRALVNSSSPAMLLVNLIKSKAQIIHVYSG